MIILIKIVPNDYPRESRIDHRFEHVIKSWRVMLGSGVDDSLLKNRFSWFETADFVGLNVV